MSESNEAHNNDEFLTLSKASEGIFRSKGSRFIAYAFRVDSETEIKKHLLSIRELHPKSRHYCYAWKLGLGDNHYRTNDDGEPSGSAGKPIFGQIRSYGLTNVFIVVVRYFGGTLLGVPGLIEAYKLSAKDAIENNLIVKDLIKEDWLIHFQYPNMNKVMSKIKRLELEVLQQDFQLDCQITVRFRSNKLSTFKSAFENEEGIKIKKIE